MKQNEKLPNYIELSEKLYELVRGENYDDVEKATELLISNLKRRSIVN
jgi:hypothetical protein